jgi:methylated-DNA-[protein]-cysteine S-methyltransferase
VTSRTTERTHTVIESPLGPLTLVNTDGVLSGVFMERRWPRPDRAAFGPKSDEGFEEATKQLNEYFAGERTDFTLPHTAEGDQFDKQVWQELMQIPYGETRSYGQVAETLGDRTLAKAVGAANARNPICVIVPCHRVIGADGSLTGYAGGLERKAFLLALENPARAVQPSLL